MFITDSLGGIGVLSEFESAEMNCLDYNEAEESIMIEVCVINCNAMYEVLASVLLFKYVNPSISVFQHCTWKWSAGP